MNLPHLFVRRAPLLLVLAILSLGLTGCKETKALQDEVDAAQMKMEKLRADGAAQESQLLAMRRAMPPAGTPEEGAKKMVLQARGELARLDAELTKAVANYTQAEAEQKAIQAELQTLRLQVPVK